jgi:glycosyltransferase involved in cell wall biosynthesis
MKITFVLPYAGLAGGIRVVAIYAERLRQRGHQVFIVSMPWPEMPFRHKVKRFLKGEGWPEKMSSDSHLDGLNIPCKVLDKWRPVVDADVPDADVVVATWWETAEWVASLSESKGAKAYFIQHYEAHDGQPKQRVDATWTLPLHKITISRWLADLATKRFGDQHVSLVLNSVDTDQFYAPSRGKQPFPTVGMLYSSKKWKGSDIALKAYTKVAQEIPNLRLIAFGEEKLLTHLSILDSNNYFQRPDQSFIRNIYAQCDVWLSSSWSEGFCLPPLEAMACHCPVVSTDVGGLSDFVSNGQEGYLVPPGNVDELARRLIEVLSYSESRWQTMSEAAYLSATRYSWDDATDLFEDALHFAITKQKKSDVAQSGRTYANHEV